MTQSALNHLHSAIKPILDQYLNKSHTFPSNVKCWNLNLSLRQVVVYFLAVAVWPLVGRCYWAESLISGKIKVIMKVRLKWNHSESVSRNYCNLQGHWGNLYSSWLRFYSFTTYKDCLKKITKQHKEADKGKARPQVTSWNMTSPPELSVRRLNKSVLKASDSKNKQNSC